MPDGYTGADVYTRMHRYGGNTASLDVGQQAADALKAAHETLMTRIARLQGKMDASWEGDAAGKARAGLTPLLETSQQASEDLGRSAQSLTAQNGGFHGTLNKLAPMDTNRPDTNDLASYNPFHASDSEKAAARWDDADRNNKEAYGAYVATTNGNRSSSAKDYPVLNAAPAGLSVGPTPSGKGAPGGIGGTGGSGGHRVGRHGGGYSPNAGSIGNTGQVGSSAPPPVVDSVPGSGNSPAQHATAPDSTTMAGYTPKAPVSNAPGFGTGLLPTFGPNSSGTDPVVGGGFGGPGGSFGTPGSGFGAPGSGGESSVGGRTGAGGSAGARSGAGGGRQLGAGAGTGTGTPAGGQSAARAGGVAGGPGAKGSPGMGGMGAGAGKGKSTEDEEHQRKVTYLDEDVDELFGGYPDGMRPTPPTIGA
ncbi:WXG100 family type VII secretion target [Amycolatopsis panacis]|uniref:WXG100 family type VII secretion target n=1 Tax=Amycolatopsis panacis TaxID=2340917 RepID=A0A419IAR1_9PSEU|nr:WXG100 family type VII secretion target [Amycolatopsis panacis]RJQ90678.1 WXG100 family type VII secretion target [Amycolatopsis panacis]